jgi:hypothetical protein
MIAPAYKYIYLMAASMKFGDGLTASADADVIFNGMCG